MIQIGHNWAEPLSHVVVEDIIVNDQFVITCYNTTLALHYLANYSAVASHVNNSNVT